MASKPTSTSTPSVVQLFGPRVTDDEEEIAVGLPSPTPSFAARQADGPVALVAPELAGRPKVWFVIGPGRTGKTTLLRYAMEKVTGNGGNAVVAHLNETQPTAGALTAQHHIVRDAEVGAEG